MSKLLLLIGAAIRCMQSKQTPPKSRVGSMVDPFQIQIRFSLNRMLSYLIYFLVRKKFFGPDSHCGGRISHSCVISKYVHNVDVINHEINDVISTTFIGNDSRAEMFFR